MNGKLKLLGYYNYTVVLTYIGMLTGFIGIAYATGGSIYKAIVCLMIAGICDMFDGAIASRRKRNRQEKCFGIQIDSLSDLICFGAFPSLIVYSQNRDNRVALAICALYLLCALIRLAYFNVDEQERQQNSDVSREIYHGLPVTTSSLFVPVAQGLSRMFTSGATVIMTVTLLVMAVMFLVPFRLKKPGMAGKISIVLFGIFEFFFVYFTCGVA